MKLLSERLRWAMSEESKRLGYEIRAADLTRAAKASSASVNFWLNDVNGIGAVKARLLGEFLHVDPIWLETGEGQPVPQIADVPAVHSNVDDAPAIVRPRQLIPVVGRVQAGNDGLLHVDDFNVEHPDGYLEWYATCADAYALRVRGESMSPRYLPGEFVGVDPCGEALPSDEVIVLLRDGRRMLKRLLWMRDGQACYESVNKNFPNIVLDCADIERMHLVLGHIPKVVFRPNL